MALKFEGNPGMPTMATGTSPKKPNAGAPAMKAGVREAPQSYPNKPNPSQGHGMKPTNREAPRSYPKGNLKIDPKVLSTKNEV